MAGPPVQVAAARTAVRRALAEVPAGPVLVACSGGPDSLALAAATAFVAPRVDRPAGAVVVDHGWSADSAGVAEQAAAHCRGLGLDPVQVVRVAVDRIAVDRAAAARPARPGPGAGGPEAAARTARYAALGAVALAAGAVAVLVGHTLDDQAESVLLGLARGSGGRSLAGMAAVRPLDAVAGEVADGAVGSRAGSPAGSAVLLVRPFLGLRRADAEQVCRLVGLTPWHDPANADPAYARARVRAATGLLTDLLGPGTVEALARTADLLRDDADALDAAALRLLDAAHRAPAGPDGRDGSAGPGGLDVAVLAAAPAAVRRRALLLAARRAGSPAGALARRHVLALDALVVAWRGQGEAHLPGRVVGRRVCGRLLFAPGPR